jgi:hypothetical protein
VFGLRRQERKVGRLHIFTTALALVAEDLALCIFTVRGWALGWAPFTIPPQLGEFASVTSVSTNGAEVVGS